MTANLLNQYIEAGIIQFGRFGTSDGGFAPLSINFLLLPSYPALMQATAQALSPILKSMNVERLLTTRAAIPLGAVAAVESGIPLTYPHGQASSITSAYVIEGAYDVGHPTALLCYILQDAEDLLRLIEPAQTVGLEVRGVACLFALGEGVRAVLRARGLAVYELLHLETALAQIAADGLMPPLLYEPILAWLAAQ